MFGKDKVLMKIKKIFAVLLALAMVLCTFNICAFADNGANGTETDTQLSGDGTSESPYLINNIDDLKRFRDDVNNGNDYSNKCVRLENDINLESEEWTPIGYNGKIFNGCFDGNDKTVSNLVITKTLENKAENNGIGFFGKTIENAVIKNLTIENVDITGSLYIAAVVGLAYTGKSIENVTVKGNIFIDAWWYAAAIGGSGYMSNVTNCHVDGNDGSYIKGNDGSYIGGIWGFRGEGSNSITNCTVKNIAIIGVDRVGGISGMAHYQNTISGCSAESVTVTATDATATTIGLIAGACQGKDGATSTIKDNTVINTTAKVGEKEVNSIYGTNIDGETPVTNYVAEVNGTQYETLAEAINKAAEIGATVKVINNIELAAKVSVPAGKAVTLDLNGKKITYAESFKITSGSKALIAVARGADLTIIDSSEEQTGVIDGSTDKEKVYAAVKVIDTDDKETDNVAKLTVNGGTLKGYYYAIFGNGSSDNTEITINGGYICAVAENDNAAIYHPQNGKLTVNGGKLEGASTIYFCAGDLEINGGELIANGDKKDYVSRGNGFYPTGDALVVDNRYNGTNGYGEVTVSITGGTFKSANAEAVGSYVLVIDGKAVGTALTGFIGGGTFSSDVEALCKDGYETTENDDGSFGITAKKVAVIGETEYTSLQEAFDAAADGATVKLIADVALGKNVKINKNINVTLDLNGKEVTSSASWVYAAGNDALISVCRGSHLTVTDSSDEKNGSVDATTDTNKAHIAVKVTEYGESATGDAAKLTVNNGTLKGYYYAVVGNGNRDNTEITINGGSLIAVCETVGAAIYHPQDGTLTINGGTLEGNSALYFCAGDLVITGGKLIGNGEKSDYQSENGSFHTTGDALIIDNRYNVGANGYGKVTVSITGGEFVSKNAAAVTSHLNACASEEQTALTGFIGGGTFSSDVTALCKDGYKAAKNEDGTYGVSKTEKYESGIYYVKGYVPAGKSEYPYAILFTAGIDSLGYKTAGFRVTIDGVTNDLYINGYVWSKLTVNLKDQGSVELTPEQYNSNAKYIMYYILTFDESVLSAIGEKNVTVSAFVVTHDGEYLFTDSSNIGKVNS